MLRACAILFWVALFESQSLAAGAFRDDVIELMKKAVQRAMDEGEAPGAVVVVGLGEQREMLVMGQRAEQPQKALMSADTIFDVASLTKVVATTSVVMKLLEAGKLELELPIKTWLPEFVGEGRDEVKLRHLLTHTSGLAAGIALNPGWMGREAGRNLALTARPLRGVDEVFRYSDLNYLLLGEIVERVSGERLDRFAEKEIFAPLKMNSTGFVPAESLRGRIAPTARDEAGDWLRGVVHDPTSRRMGGVTGHAGLFSCAEDLARFAQMLANGGELDGVRIFNEETVKLMTSVQSPPTIFARRGLGWDLDSAYSRSRGKIFPLGTFGHTGFTGVSFWVNPATKSYVVVLASRLHPDGKGNVIPLQEELATLAAESLLNVDFERVADAFSPRLSEDEVPTVLNGIDVLRRRDFAELKGLKVGLVTNHSGIDNGRRSTIDWMHEAKHVNLVALFSPEHGIRGMEDRDKIADGRDAKTGLRVFSLYGERRGPSAEQLAMLDVLVFDIQDIGCRFYTYISTLQKCMEAAAKAGKRVLVLDRVNPIGGEVVEGPAVLDKETFVGCHPMALRHGMTVGELAMMMNAERGLGCDLEVIKVEGWKRGMEFDRTGLPWLNPSPNMRSLNAALLYPGVGLLESAVSVGRGTDTPFEVIGAPYVDDARLAFELNQAGLKGVRFVPERFTPKASVFKDQVCGGVRMVITSREDLRSVDVGMALACTLQRLYPKEFKLQAMGTLLLHPTTLKAIKEGQNWKAIDAGWSLELEAFKKRREAFLLYP
ncbi:DUF1343 domain-containing protein [Phragmitibacter flavus]|uniref:DUF1343 domain-containing protein n=1 Tax=Phragmitibacter flavus TaxID=2576071 RepID=A0A5R8K7K3_9BACT|nr:exo-beta-N-acetylmuramidase NamZ domain-containing protein [Phragmitibacter flavus]TLD68333.1 DUF1343 domain-containing protein [Phragmitibacter flavus]